MWFTSTILLIVLIHAKNYNCRKIFESCLEIPEYGFYNNRLNDTIQCFRQLMIRGIPELGMPSFAPLKSNLTDIDIDNPFLYTDIKLKNVQIAGLADFKVVSISTSKTFYSPDPIHDNIEYYFSNLTFSANYKGKANFFGLMTYTGQGKLIITLKNTRLATITYYQMQPPLVGDFRTLVYVKNVTVSVTGVQGKEDLNTLVSNSLSRMIQFVFDAFPDWVSATLNEMGKIVLNKIYGDLGYEDYYNAVITLNLMPVSDGVPRTEHRSHALYIMQPINFSSIGVCIGATSLAGICNCSKMKSHMSETVDRSGIIENPQVQSTFSF
ncbi:hypothetical protein RN001_009472 [Aquatica leii]|uniref:Uncharacterized protein n=1 Tax=Aquatica leii TaxID=1421715 RepID=A0AAN7P8T5_9COLE|nr:hypothetical protein RN001_009472 [Aquatica leii]